MKLEIKDMPGQLVAALRPISDVGGNIIAVIHQHESATVRTGTLGVQIVLEISESGLSELIRLLKAGGVTILRIGEERMLIRRSFILIGHLMHTDLSDTVDRIDSTGFAEVAELTMMMPAINEPTSAKMIIKSESMEGLLKALEILRKTADQKEILIIEPLEEKQ